MSFAVQNFCDDRNRDIKVLMSQGPFQVIEYQKDLSVSPNLAAQIFFCNKMNIRKRQLVCQVGNSGITVQAGAMQWTVGNVGATTGIKGVGDLMSKAIRGKATGESAIKPEYVGQGLLVLEPTYRHLILMNAAEWGGAVVLDDGLFLACESTLKHKAVMRSNFSSAVAG